MVSVGFRRVASESVKEKEDVASSVQGEWETVVKERVVRTNARKEKVVRKVN